MIKNKMEIFKSPEDFTNYLIERKRNEPKGSYTSFITDYLATVNLHHGLDFKEEDILPLIDNAIVNKLAEENGIKDFGG